MNNLCRFCTTVLLSFVVISCAREPCPPCATHYPSDEYVHVTNEPGGLARIWNAARGSRSRQLSHCDSLASEFYLLHPSGRFEIYQWREGAFDRLPIDLSWQATNSYGGLGPNGSCPYAEWQLIVTETDSAETFFSAKLSCLMPWSIKVYRAEGPGAETAIVSDLAWVAGTCDDLPALEEQP